MATDFTMVVPGGILNIVGAEEGGIFCVAAAAAARAAMPLMGWLPPIVCEVNKANKKMPINIQKLHYFANKTKSYFKYLLPLAHFGQAPPFAHQEEET